MRSYKIAVQFTVALLLIMFLFSLDNVKADTVIEEKTVQLRDSYWYTFIPDTSDGNRVYCDYSITDYNGSTMIIGFSFLAAIVVSSIPVI